MNKRMDLRRPKMWPALVYRANVQLKLNTNPHAGRRSRKSVSLYLQNGKSLLQTNYLLEPIRDTRPRVDIIENYMFCVVYSRPKAGWVDKWTVYRPDRRTCTLRNSISFKVYS